LAHTDHDSLVSRATHDRGKDGARSVITCETGLAHTRPIVNDQGLIIFIVIVIIITAEQAHGEVKSGLIGDIRHVAQDATVGGQGHLISREAGSVLDHGLDSLDRVGGADIIGGRVHEDLHCWKRVVEEYLFLKL
jgi:hypothetical protein